MASTNSKTTKATKAPTMKIFAKTGTRTVPMGQKWTLAIDAGSPYQNLTTGEYLRQDMMRGRIIRGAVEMPWGFVWNVGQTTFCVSSFWIQEQEAE